MRKLLDKYGMCTSIFFKGKVWLEEVRICAAIMTRLIKKNVFFLIFSIFVVFSCLSVASAEESLSIFPEVFTKVLDNYVEQPEISFLTSGAISGMDNTLASINKVFVKNDIDLRSINEDKSKALGLIETVLEKFSKTSGLQAKELEYAAIKGMLKSLDPHSAFLTPEEYKELQVDTKGEFAGIGIQIGIKNDTITVIAPIEDTPADRAGVKAGDKILKIDNESTKGMSLNDAVKRMRGVKGTKVFITINRESLNEPKTFEITRDLIKVKSVSSRMLEEGIGYLKITQFQEITSLDVETALNKMGSRDSKLKGLIIDLRNNPGGLLKVSVDVADKFIDSDLIVYIKGRIADSSTKFAGKTIGTHPPYPIIVLINEGSASASEIVSGALQDLNKAIVMGKRTFGKGTVQTILPLSDGSAIRLTTAKYYLPSDRSIQSGITPDVDIEEREGSDIPLSVAQAALQSALSKSGYTSNEKLRKIAIEISKESKMIRLSSKQEVAKETFASNMESEIDSVPSIKSKLNKNSYAIVIGIEQYRQKLPKADYAVDDARLVTEYLTKTMGYPEENVITLINDNAALGDLTKYFEKWLPNNVEKDGTVFIYYSGHGAPNPKTGDAYIVPFDGDPAFIDETGYSVRRLYEKLGRLNVKEVIVALDSCFSGAGGKSVIAKGARPLVMQMESFSLPAKISVLSAASGEQISSTYNEKRHGLFTYFMLKALKGEGDLNKDGKIEIRELYDYIKPLVERIARKTYNNEQTPQLIVPKQGQQIYLRD